MKPNSTPTTRRQLCALAVALLTAAQTAPVAAADAVNADGATSWVALCEGAIVLFRHAMAPGIGDPPNFKLGDCRHGQSQKAARGGFRPFGLAVPYQVGHGPVSTSLSSNRACRSPHRL